MRALPIYPLVFFVVLTLTGCSAVAGASGSPPASSPSSSSAPAAAAPTSAPTGATSLPPGFKALTDSNDPTTAAVQAVIQKANQEQQDAFAKNDPTIMQDTATSSYYNELVQINSDMANGGVSDIKLVKLEWGPVNVTSPTTAEATTYETWQTTFSDGSTDQSREQNNYTLAQQNGNWLIQTDDHPDANPGGSGGNPGSGFPGLPPVPSSPSGPNPSAPRTPPSGAGVSRNWSGYAASGNFSAVTGTWTIPQAQSNGSGSSGATWVGIGGLDSRDLIQAGTEETVTRSGGIRYDAWIETLPRAAHQIQFAVKPGDSVTVSLTEQSTDQWLIEFKNNTTGQTYQSNVQYQSSNSSAEWIEEAPSAGRRLLPIDNFGTIQFSGGTAVENGKTVSIADAGAHSITMTGRGGNSLVTPSGLTPDGQGFSVTYAGS